MTGWRSIDAFLNGQGIRIGPPTVAQTTGGGHANGSLHYLGLARDYGDADSDVTAVTQAVLPYAVGPGAPVVELFSSRDGVFYKNGAAFVPDAALRAQHYNHVHVGVRSGVDLSTAQPPSGATTHPSAVLTSIGGSSSSVSTSIGRVLVEGVFVAGALALVALGVTRTATGRSR